MVSANVNVFIAAAPGAGELLIHLDVGSPEPYDTDEAVIPVQTLNHAADHRSQVCTILTTLGIAPPEPERLGVEPGRQAHVAGVGGRLRRRSCAGPGG